jgi:hypothetical protein
VVLPVGKIIGEDISYYHRYGAIGSTMFRQYLASPREYWFRHCSGEWEGNSDDSGALEFGRVAHSVILEGKKYTFPRTKIDRRTKFGNAQYRAFVENNNDCHILDHGDGITLDRMIKYGIGANEVAKKLVGGCESYETTYRAKYGNIYLQCRPDGMAENYIIDLKTCRRVSGFLPEFWKYGYHIQAAWYNFVIGLCEESRRDFEFIVVEKEGGYECVVFEYKREESEKVWEIISAPVLKEMVKSLEGGNFGSMHKTVETITTPERCFQWHS